MTCSHVLLYCCLLAEAENIIVSQDLCDAGVQLLSQQTEVVLNSAPNNVTAIPVARH